MEPFCYTDDLAVGYDGAALIRELALRLHRGRILAVIGPNGAGKSTILKTVAGQLARVSGTITLDGRALDALGARGLSRRLAVVLTDRHRTERMTCQEVVEAGRYPYTGWLGILSYEDHAQVRAAMELARVWELRTKDFMRVSDGQRQRVLLARAVCQQPQLLVLDEPTSFLDIGYELELAEILRVMTRERGVAVMLSLHELGLAQRVADDVLCVGDGRVTAYGSAEELFTRQRVQTLFGLASGSYDPLLCSLELKRAEGAPHVFVIAGGGTGIPAYRALQKRGIPFSTGVLHENDVDYRVAQALSCEIAAERSFAPISDAAFTQALMQMRRCGTVLNRLDAYGLINVRNRDLLAQARAEGLRVAESVEQV